MERTVRSSGLDGHEAGAPVPKLLPEMPASESDAAARLLGCDKDPRSHRSPSEGEWHLAQLWPQPGAAVVERQRGREAERQRGRKAERQRG